MENPCYNTKTKQDCPNRHKGCAVGCDAWNEYLIRREQERKQVQQRNQAEKDILGYNCQLDSEFKLIRFKQKKNLM